jgi:hypothetical protein
MALDSKGNLYVADTDNHTIRRISPEGEVTTLAGKAGELGDKDGLGGSARFYFPRGLEVDSSGSIWVAIKGIIGSAESVRRVP